MVDQDKTDLMDYLVELVMMGVMDLLGDQGKLVHLDSLATLDLLAYLGDKGKMVEMDKMVEQVIAVPLVYQEETALKEKLAIKEIWALLVFEVIPEVLVYLVKLDYLVILVKMDLMAWMVDQD